MIVQEMTGAAVTIEALKREGIKYVFGLPGTTIMPLLNELYEDEQIRFVTVRHEQVAAFMADGYSRATKDGDIGVCLASRGPGAANMTIGLHNSYAESVPVLALIGQVSDEHYYREAFEEMDLIKFFEPVTKWSMEIHHAKRIPELLQRAVRTAASGRPRPVMVSIPFNLLSEKVEQIKFHQKHRQKYSMPALEDIREALQMINKAKNPVVLLGGGSSTATSDIVQLAEILQLPVITTWLRKDVFPNNHSLYFGTLGYGAYEVSERLVADADVIFSIGCHFSEFTTKKWTLISEKTDIIQLDIDPEEIGKIYEIKLGLCGDAALTLKSMTRILPEIETEKNTVVNRKKWIQEESERLVQESKLPKDSPTEYVSSHDLVVSVQEVINKHNPSLVMDVPTFGVWAQRYLQIKESKKYYGSAGGSMGWGLPAAMGIKLARPEELVLSIIGDGSFWMVAQDLETAVRENIPVICLIVNNFSFGNTRDRQKNTYGGKYLGVFYDNPDFAEYAKLLNAYGERIESADDLLPAIERAIASGKPAVIDIIQDQFEGLPEGLTPIGAEKID
ncbi:thiamine pyrophosphate-binding protein [Robertmurraya massiliosenegalensis]|uniref:thiamine pyrophosphate-binding protein n=1 Tax=Robertmurraya TaxID=2837507 RepID=UPI0039A61BDC